VRKRAFLRMNEVFSNYPKCLNVIYEEMFVDQNGSRFKDSLLATISTFLGIPNAFDPRPRLTKLLPGDIYSYIENSEEVRRRFAGEAGAVRSWDGGPAQAAGATRG
jgi:hypothetical protein